MTEDGWRDVVKKAATDPEIASLLVKVLVDLDEAKQALRDKGYGCTGMSLLRTVEEVPEL